MRLLTAAISLVAPFTVLACESTQPSASQYSLGFSVVDDRNQALQGIPIQVGQTSFGTTDDAGELRANVYAFDGDRFPLHAQCPDSYGTAKKPKNIAFWETRGLDGEKITAMELQVVCKRLTQVAAILVHADGREGLPILVDGVVSGKTGPGGIAHVRFDGAPGTQFQVSLDTSLNSKLVPSNPRQELQIGVEDGLFIFDTVFSESVSKPQRKTRRRRPRHSESDISAPTRKRPIKID